MQDTRLSKIYYKLFAKFGPQNWWPTTRHNSYPEYFGGPIDDKERFEVMVGAILTQNTSWSNVEKAIKNMIQNEMLDHKNILKADQEVLATIIRSSGYHNQKAKKLKQLAIFIQENPIVELKRLETQDLREKLLSIKGVGPETADSIILYSLNKPIPVVDAYTKRIFSRIGLLDEKRSYDEFQEYQSDNFENDPYKLQELHALLVIHAKEYCTKANPDCWMCPIYDDCEKNY